MIGTNLNLDLPSGSDSMAVIVAKLVAALSLVQDSIADDVTPSGMNINGALDLNGNALTEASSILLASGTAPTPAGSLYYHSGEFYAIDATGTIQLTSLGQLNAAGIGGIVGDYGGVNPARVSYDNASGQYRFTRSAGVWADGVFQNVILESTAGAVKLSAPSGLSAGYTVTFPTAVPASAGVMEMDNAGNVTVVATKSKTLVIPSFAARMIPSAGAMGSDDTGAIINFGTGSGASGLIAQWPVSLPIGATITGYTAYLYKISNGSCVVLTELQGWNYTGGSAGISSQVYTSPGTGTETTSADGSGTAVVTTLTLNGISQTIAAGNQYHISWRSGAVELGDRMYQVDVHYTEPTI